MLPVRAAFDRREVTLEAIDVPLRLDRLVPGAGPWEVEIGFGKGRFLLERAARAPGRRYLGVEVASLYYRRVRARAARRRLDNLLLLRGEALYLLSAVLPAGFAETVHVYFPDPWPKARHRRRRLFDVDSVDLIIGLLRAGGRLLFASDSVPYGRYVARLLGSHPGVDVRRRAEPWPEGARTNYEAKYERQGRPILRLEAQRTAADGSSVVHPSGRSALVAAVAAAPDLGDQEEAEEVSG